MPVEKQCASCDKLFTCNRSHAETCSSTCRGRLWRERKEPVVLVKLSLSASLYKRIIADADARNVSLSSWLVSRAIGIAIPTVTTF